MKIAVDFPSVAYREGPEQVLALATAIDPGNANAYPFIGTKHSGWNKVNC